MFNCCLSPKIIFFIVGNYLKAHNGMKFTTVDQDNDTYSKNCALTQTGSWWYYHCASCDLSRTNNNPHWYGSVSKPVMMFRKIRT